MRSCRRAIYRYHVRLVVYLWFLFFQGVCAAAAPGDVWAPFETPWFDRVGITNGLPDAITTSLAQDSNGLMWIGTMGGLVRYDGYHLQIFSVAGNGPTDLPDTYVRSLLALPNGGLLIGTNTGGLVRFDPSTNSFYHYPIGKDGTTDRKIYALADDHNHGVWVATDQGLDHLDLIKNRLDNIALAPEMAPRNLGVLQDRAGNLWVGNNQGLFVRYTGTTVFVRPNHPSGTIASVLNDQIWSIREDHEGRVWVGSRQNGAVFRDSDGHWQSIPGLSGHPTGLAQSTVRDFLETAPNVMWIGSDGGGVIEFNVTSDQVRSLVNDPTVQSSLPGNSVRALLKDRLGNLWAATDMGVAHHDPGAHIALSLVPSPSYGNTLFDISIHSLYTDSRGRIWVGFSEGRIDVIDLYAGVTRHMRLTGSQAQRDVLAFTEAPDGSVWVGTQGIAQIDPDTLLIHDNSIPALNDIPVLSLQRDGKHVLIGTYDGIYRYDPSTHSLEHFKHNPNDPHSLSSDTVMQITQVDGHWWFSTAYGISVDANAHTSGYFENIRNHPNDPASLPQNYVSSLAHDSKGRWWVSTFGGIGVIDHANTEGPYHFQTINRHDGLTSDQVHALLPDDYGNIWASGSNGIAKINQDTHTVQNLSVRDGLHASSFTHIAATRSPTGELIFGGMYGLVVIRPDCKPPMTPLSAPLAITRVVVRGKTAPFADLPHEGGSLVLGKHDQGLQLDFALLDYQSPVETAYSYRMEGLDEDWIDIPKGSLPSVVYTTLPYGHYTLQLRAQTLGLQPRTVTTRLGIAIKPLWYETPGTRIIAALVLLLLVAGLIHLRTLYLRRQAVQLQRQVDERTRDLLIANEQLDKLANTDGLTGIYNRRHFLEVAKQEHDKYGKHPICMGLLDLDRFKVVNDTYGHLAGDEVIRHMADTIKKCCRPGDLVGRYGGEEFVLCLPGTSLQNALAVSERIRDAISRHVVMHAGQTISITVSIGIAALRDNETIEQWLARADGALYEAKHGGRNRSVAAS